MVTGGRTLRQVMPLGGWPAEPCERFMFEHPGHGWLRAGALCWCGPADCRARRMTVGGNADGVAMEAKDER